MPRLLIAILGLLGAVPTGQAGTRWLEPPVLLAPQREGDGGISDRFGSALAFDGTRLVVGAPGATVPGGASAFGDEAGLAWVYLRDGDDFVESARLVAAERGFDDLFGYALAQDGERIAVGAPGTTRGGLERRGAVHVFERTGTGAWAQTATLVPPGSAAFDVVGVAVALSGDRLAVGAAGRDALAGAVYVYEYAAGQWQLTATLSAPDAAAGDQFGTSVALAGELLVVGAPLVEDSGGPGDSGAIYVYERVAGVWTPVQRLTDLAATPGALLGHAVTLRDGALFAAAPGDSNGTGTVIHWQRAGGAFASPQRIVPPGLEDFDQYGSSLAWDGEVLVVGARNFNGGEGAAFVYARAGGAWELLAPLVFFDGPPADSAGAAVAVAGDRVLVGAPFGQVGTARAAGHLDVYRRDGPEWPRVARLDRGAGARGQLFGGALAIRGGLALIGASGADPLPAGDDAGEASVWERDASGAWQQSAALVMPDGQSEDRFGVAVGIGAAHLAVGAFGDVIGGRLDQGSVWIYRRDPGGWAPAQQLVAADGLGGDGFGFSLAMDDSLLVVGAPGHDAAGAQAGAAYVYRAIGGAWQFEAKLLPPPGSGGFAGISVALDGERVAVGAPAARVGSATAQGVVHVYVRSQGAWILEQTVIAPDGAANDVFGSAVTFGGGRLVVGAPDDSEGTDLPAHGSVHVYVREGGAWTRAWRLLAPTLEPGMRFGEAVAADAGRLVVGAPGASVGGVPAQGRVYAYGAPGSAPVAVLEAPAAPAHAGFGSRLALDFGRLAVGTPEESGTNVLEGRVRLYTDADRIFRDGLER